MREPLNLDRTTRRKASLIAIIVLFSVFWIPIRSGVAQQPDLAQMAVAYATRSYDIPLEQAELVHSTWLANRIYRGKVLDKRTGAIYVVSLQLSGDAATDEDVNSIIEAELNEGFVGKINALLRQKAEADQGGFSKVAIWVKTPPVPYDKWRADIEAGKRDQVFKEARDFHSLAEAPLKGFLTSRSIPIKYASPLAPVVCADLPNILLSALEKHPDVARIYADEIPDSALSNSIPTIKANDVWALGYTGGGQYSKVAVVESLDHGLSAVANDNPYLGPVTFYNTNNTQASSHASGVAGVVVSNHITYKGVSHGVSRPGNLLSGNPDYNNNQTVNTATEWAAQQGAAVINQSYGINSNGTINIYGIWDDYIVKLYGPTVVACAGNYCSTTPCSYNVWDPAIGYNVIAVGSFYTNNNIKWKDDVMASDSCYINPSSPHGDREKPELAAPGGVMTTSSVPPWDQFVYDTGTSFAAPHVTGTVALFGSTGGYMRYLADVMKAVLMVSATHNIEGDSRLSDKDGAGGLNAKAAWDVLTNGWTDYHAMPGYCLDSGEQPQFSATAGQTVRAAISWLVGVDPNTGVYTFQDADLVVVDPTATQFWTSASFDNNFELVQFTAPVTGTYKMNWCYKHGSSFPLPRMAYAYYVQ